MYVYLFIFILKTIVLCENDLFDYHTFTRHIDQYDY